MCCSGGPTSIRNQNFRLVPFLASATSRSSSTPETPLHTHNYLPTHRASGSLQTALSKVLRNQASAQSNFICRNTSDRELALTSTASRAYAFAGVQAEKAPINHK